MIFANIRGAAARLNFWSILLKREVPTKITWNSKTPLRTGSYGAMHPLVAWEERSGRLASRPRVL